MIRTTASWCWARAHNGRVQHLFVFPWPDDAAEYVRTFCGAQLRIGRPDDRRPRCPKCELQRVKVST